MADDGLTGLYIAYTLVWLGLLAYLIYIHTLQERLRREMTIFERRMRARERRKDGETGREV